MVVAARLDVHTKTFQTHAASCEFYGMAMPVLAAIVTPHHENCPDISVNERRLAWKPPMGLIGLLYSAELGLRTKNLKLSSEKHSCILDFNAIHRGRGWHGDAHPPPHPQPMADHRLRTGVSRRRRHPNRSRLPTSSVDAGFEWRHGWQKEMLLLPMRRRRAPRVAPIWEAGRGQGCPFRSLRPRSSAVFRQWDCVSNVFSLPQTLSLRAGATCSAAGKGVEPFNCDFGRMRLESGTPAALTECWPHVCNSHVCSSHGVLGPGRQKK